MIIECKGILEAAIKQHTGMPTVVKSVKDEKDRLSKKDFPFASLITQPGVFDDRSAREDKYIDSKTRTRKQRFIRGKRNLPITIRLYTTDEKNADRLMSDIIRNIPRRFTLAGLEGRITIEQEEYSDHVTRLTDKYMSICLVTFSVDVATDPVEIASIKSSGMDPELQQRRT